MLKWFQSKLKPPKLAAGNIGEAVSLRNPHSKEEIHLADVLADVLTSMGKSIKKRKFWLEVEGGFVLQPHIVDLKDSPKGVRTATTIDVNHRTLFPSGLFEYQHAAGDTARESIQKGFENWAELDLPVLADAARAKPETCTMLVFTPEADQSSWPHARRAVLGPISVLQERPVPTESCEEGHPFCPCCLLTKNFQAFDELISGDAFYGIRLYAGRHNDGPAADCRVNGVDFPAGAEALRRYVKTWPDCGFEFRKQFIVVQPYDDEARSMLT